MHHHDTRQPRDQVVEGHWQVDHVVVGHEHPKSVELQVP